mmetsp:Transcript_58070/g.64987  ORF Transcript_58070/g.64987 Transcript_58070/m.64987 type:complete len:230 (-) Transcript_58070:171-860(-)
MMTTSRLNLNALCLVAMIALSTTLMLTTTTHAFAPPTMISRLQTTKTTTTVFASGLEVVNDETDADKESKKDPFDMYQLTPEQTEVCIKDTKLGDPEAYTMGDKEKQVLTIAYKATFLEDGRRFDFAEDFVCKTGSDAILPGFEEGLKGMKVGGTRIIKIPPNKGYGDKWFKGTIPPNSHLQFDCELKGIAQTPKEEFMVQAENFGIGRGIGIAFCVSYLALSPFLHLP